MGDRALVPGVIDGGNPLPPEGHQREFARIAAPDDPLTVHRPSANDPIAVRVDENNPDRCLPQRQPSREPQLRPDRGAAIGRDVPWGQRLRSG